MRVLGIETSCDETGVALYCRRQGLLAQRLFTQSSIHEAYGGVVPELASRDHVRKTLPLVREVLAEAGVSETGPDGVAYTAGPGLSGALLVGASVGRSLALAWQCPALAVHHMEAHLLAPMLEDEPPAFPFVALLVSGGHTQLVAVQGIGDYRLLGESVDDAAGEAFDKAAKMMALGYPGGPALAKLAAQGDPERYRFPRPMIDKPHLDFSFSGLKTACLHALRRAEAQGSLDEAEKAAIAAGYQQALVDTLVHKCRRALAQTGLSRLVVAGGVSANQRLREGLAAMAEAADARVYYPRLELCTDNGAMVAYAGCQRLAAGERSSEAIRVTPRWPLTELLPPAG